MLLSLFGKRIVPFVLALATGLALATSSPKTCEKVSRVAAEPVVAAPVFPTRLARNCVPAKTRKGPRIKQAEKDISELYRQRRKIVKDLKRTKGVSPIDRELSVLWLSVYDQAIERRIRGLERTGFSEVEDLLYRERCDNF